MGIDKPGNDPFVPRIHCLRAGWNPDICTCTDVANLSIFNNNGSITNGGPSCSRNDRRALDHHDSAWLLREKRSSKDQDQKTANLPRTHVCPLRAGFEFPFEP